MTFLDWLEDVKGISLSDYLNMTKDERVKINDEFMVYFSRNPNCLKSLDVVN